jgi:hypothetical protein
MRILTAVLRALGLLKEASKKDDTEKKEYAELKRVATDAEKAAAEAERVEIELRKKEPR